MKAMTCPQCGALISKISSRDKFALCDYCEAKILLAPNTEKTEKTCDADEATPYQKYLKTREENARRYAAMNPPADVPAEDKSLALSAMSVLLLIFVPIFIIFGSGRSCLDRPSEPSKKTLATTAAPILTPLPFTTNEPVFLPQINYSVSVKWNGANDMEHFETPSIDRSKLPTTDIKELKKTVFANRSVQVRVTIDENGEVTQAKAVSGHQILKEAAENAALKTLFANRSKPTNRVLTYIFRLIEK